MKLFAASLATVALIASPALAQNAPASAPATSTTHVKTTTKEIHETNVPKHTAHHKVTHHHAMQCGCPSTHAKHHGKAHHVEKKTTTTTTTKSQ